VYFLLVQINHTVVIDAQTFCSASAPSCAYRGTPGGDLNVQFGGNPNNMAVHEHSHPHKSPAEKHLNAFRLQGIFWDDLTLTHVVFKT
jgi:hypothetical protein